MLNGNKDLYRNMQASISISNLHIVMVMPRDQSDHCPRFELMAVDIIAVGRLSFKIKEKEPARKALSSIRIEVPEFLLMFRFEYISFPEEVRHTEPGDEKCNLIYLSFRAPLFYD